MLFRSGPKQDPEGAYAAVIPSFIMTLLSHKTPVINGDGSVSRDFTFVDSVVQANHLAALAEHPEALNTIYNVAHGKRTTLNELVELIRDQIGEFDSEVRKIEAKHGPARKGDIAHSLASVEKAERLLGYRPGHTLKEGMALTVKWFSGNK